MKSYLLFGLFLLSSVAMARPNADELRICYLFNKDDVVNKGACVVSAGHGAGGLYYNFDYKGLKLLLEI